MKVSTSSQSPAMQHVTVSSPRFGLNDEKEINLTNYDGLSHGTWNERQACLASFNPIQVTGTEATPCTPQHFKGSHGWSAGILPVDQHRFLEHALGESLLCARFSRLANAIESNQARTSDFTSLRGTRRAPPKMYPLWFLRKTRTPLALTAGYSRVETHRSFETRLVQTQDRRYCLIMPLRVETSMIRPTKEH